jgi:hypothetical protein
MKKQGEKSKAQSFKKKIHALFFIARSSENSLRVPPVVRVAARDFLSVIPSASSLDETSTACVAALLCPQPMMITNDDDYAILSVRPLLSSKGGFVRTIVLR